MLLTSYEGIKGVYVHNGFYEQLLPVRQLILDFLSTNATINPFDKIVVCGHSLGGGLATITAPIIAKYFNANKSSTDTNYKQIYMHSIASPRCGNTGFNKYYNSLNISQWRIYNEDDIVPNAANIGIYASRFYFSYYYHVNGNTLKLNNDGTVTIETNDKNSGYWGKVLRRKESVTKGVASHSSILYIDRIIAQCVSGQASIAVAMSQSPMNKLT